MIYDPVMGFKMCYKYISWIKWIISQSPQKKKTLNMRGMFDNKNKNNFKFYYCIGFRIC